MHVCMYIYLCRYMISIIVWFPVSLPRAYNLFNTKILMWSQIQRAFPWMRQFYQKHPRHWCFWKPWKLQAKSQRNTDPESLVLHWCRGDFYPSCPSVFGHVLVFFGPSCRSSQHPTLCGPSVELEWYGEISLNHIKAISRRLVFLGNHFIVSKMVEKNTNNASENQKPVFIFTSH